MRRLTKFLLGAAVLTLLAVLGFAGISSAAQVAPVTGTGNPSCAGGTKIEPVADGTYGDVTVDVTGSSFSYSTNGTILITAVIVKGGPGYNLYSYPAPGPSSDDGLTAPINPKTGNPYGLSHLCFFTTKKGEEPPK